MAYSYTTAKQTCSDAELARFACCFLNCKDMYQGIDWDAASAQFGPGVKTASFKTMTMRALKKAVASGDGAASGGKGVGTKGKGAGGRKRKAGAEDRDEQGVEGERGEVKGKKAKKAKEKADSVVGAEGEGEGAEAEAEVKSEPAGDAGEDELAF